MKWKGCDEKKLWKHVAKHLTANGITNTLVGGAVAAIYSKGAYRSGDLDIVIENITDSRKRVPEVMSRLGFEKKGRHWIHPECILFVEFVPPPVAIGNDYRIEPNVMLWNGYPLRILSPEDCVKDRLSSYIYFGAKECLEQAVLVAKAQKMVWKKIKEWCDGEGTEAQKAYRELYGACKSAK